jgi:5-methylcytosine-specific restriction endonuclease McrA
MMSSVLVLNAGYEPLHRVSVRHAIRMLVREVAVVEEVIEGQTIGKFPMPAVLRLVRYVKLHWRKEQPKWSKKRLFLRDNDTCAYCPEPAQTIDHVTPRTHGGGSTWDNTVACCLKCNRKKGSKTVKQAGMKLKFDPYTPSWHQLSI